MNIGLARLVAQDAETTYVLPPAERRRGVRMGNDSPCVLVVDDDEDVLYALRILLEGRGCRVFATSSPRAAVDYMKEFEPAVALFDIVLPGLSGLELAAEVTKRWKNCQFLMMTGHSSVETAAEAIRLGAFDYLSKPFESIENVWSAVRRALQKRAIELDREALLARIHADHAEV